MHFCKLVASLVMVISGSAFASGITAVPPGNTGTKIYQQGSILSPSVADTSRVSVTSVQDGVNNTQSVVQNARNSHADIRQDSTTWGSDITVRQTGHDPDIAFVNARTAYVQQSGATAGQVSITQDVAATAIVSQTGVNNRVMIVQQ